MDIQQHHLQDVVTSTFGYKIATQWELSPLDRSFMSGIRRKLIRFAVTGKRVKEHKPVDPESFRAILRSVPPEEDNSSPAKI